MSAPTFAVVGRPNKGKSSIVATLARDPSVHIDSRAGSTKTNRHFPMQIDGETLYELVDTPGIQRARAVVDWLNTQGADASGRPAAVARFVEEHRHDSRFSNECQMLEPIIDGAGIIYVVDGSCPFGADYEAEMEILRWTGQPSLAVINPIDSPEFVDEWKAGLGQYFQTVRVFDAHRAEPEKQVELLELFGHLDPGWQKPLSYAIEMLKADRILQQKTVSGLIAELLVDALTYSVEQSVPKGGPEKTVKKALFAQYKAHLNRREKQCRRQVEEVFYHTNLKASEEQVGIEESDLFNTENWYLWGLKKSQMVTVAAAVGGSLGLALDAATVGASLGLATLVGAATGVAGSWVYAEQIGKIKVKGIPTGGKRITYGPTGNINFPFVLLGRAIHHCRVISKRTHASQEALDLTKPLLDFLNDRERRSLAVLFAKIRAGKNVNENRAVLAEKILAWCHSDLNTGVSEISK